MEAVVVGKIALQKLVLLYQNRTQTAFPRLLLHGEREEEEEQCRSGKETFWAYVSLLAQIERRQRRVATLYKV
jgi:hypothetical protein